MSLSELSSCFFCCVLLLFGLVPAVVLSLETSEGRPFLFSTYATDINIIKEIKADVKNQP